MEAAINGGLKLYWVIAVVLAEKEKSGVGGEFERRVECDVTCSFTRCVALKNWY